MPNKTTHQHKTTIHQHNKIIIPQQQTIQHSNPSLLHVFSYTTPPHSPQQYYKIPSHTFTKNFKYLSHLYYFQRVMKIPSHVHSRKLSLVTSPVSYIPFTFAYYRIPSPHHFIAGFSNASERFLY